MWGLLLLLGGWCAHVRVILKVVKESFYEEEIFEQRSEKERHMVTR